MKPLTLFIKTRTKPGKRIKAHQLWKEYLKPRAEENDSQNVYFFCLDDNDEDVFYIFEQYKNRENFQANANAAWFNEYMEKIAPLLDGEPEVGISTPVWSKVDVDSN